MSLASGRAVAVSTAVDPETMTPRFALEALELDPETGEAADAEPIAPRREFTDPAEWRPRRRSCGAPCSPPDEGGRVPCPTASSAT